MEHNKRKPLRKHPLLGRRRAQATIVAYRGGNMLTNEFWRSLPDAFPWAIGHVFLAIATDQIARAMFGNEWSGIEPTIGRAGYNLPDRLEVQRFDKVKRKIAQLAATGTLKTMWRPPDGGELWPIDPSAWQTEQLDDRFYRCQMNPRDPFSRGFAGKGYGYIFVTEASLAHALKELAPTGPKLTALAETRCESWLAEEVAKSPRARPRAKDEFWVEAEQSFPGLSRRAFERAWGLSVPPEWSKAGPTKRNRRT